MCVCVEFGPEYVTDVQWSPQKPSVFTTVDMAGRLLLWDLNEDVQLPAELMPERMSAEGTSTTSATAGSAPTSVPPVSVSSVSNVSATQCTPLNKVRWHSNGLLLAAGDVNGRVYICNVSEVTTFAYSFFLFQLGKPRGKFIPSTFCNQVKIHSSTF